MSTSPFPKLEYYLLSTRVADHIHAAKRPENWVKWPVFLAIPLAIVYGYVWILIACGYFFFVGLPLSLWLFKRRIGAKFNANALAIAARANISSRVRRLLRGGKLVERIGENGAEALERCAAYAVAAMADQTRATMFTLGPTGQLELRKQISAAITASMNHAFVCFEPNLLGPMFARAVDPGKVQASERELEKLAAEVAAWVDSLESKSEQPDLTPIREQLRTMREMEIGFQLGEIAVGDGDLERKARERE